MEAKTAEQWGKILDHINGEVDEFLQDKNTLVQSVRLSYAETTRQKVQDVLIAADPYREVKTLRDTIVRFVKNCFALSSPDFRAQKKAFAEAKKLMAKIPALTPDEQELQEFNHRASLCN
ncbi:MAG: hypothetical protein WCV72_03875 [Patescibacteria group bacterium]